MDRKTVLLTFLMLALASNSVLTFACLHDAWAWEAEVSESAAYLPVPFHFQDLTYYCGPAALEMVFDYYGEDIPQLEIAEAANTYYSGTYDLQMLRAAHFSNLSTSVGNEMPGNITGYSARSYGYAAFETSSLTIEDLKALVDQGDPTIVLMWYGPSKVSGHYRVVVGYNTHT